MWIAEVIMLRRKYIKLQNKVPEKYPVVLMKYSNYRK
jgi:hypothetical protein